VGPEGFRGPAPAPRLQSQGGITRRRTMNLGSLGKITPDQQKLIDAAPADQKAFIKMQTQQQDQQELVTFITNILKTKADTLMAIAQNMKD